MKSYEALKMTSFSSIWSRCCIKPSLLFNERCCTLRYASNLKPQARYLYNKFFSSKNIYGYDRRNFYLNTNYRSINYITGINFSLKPKCLFFCNLSNSVNSLFYNNNRKRGKVKKLFIKKSNLVGCDYLCQNILVQNFSSKKQGLNNKNLLIKRHEYLKSVLRDKQRKIRQTQQQFKNSGKILIDDIKKTKSKMKVKMEEIIERENIWTIPNLLCVTRIVVSPYLGYLIMNSNYNLALGLVVCAGVTDLLDGLIARNFKSQSSKLGSFLDPMADKVLVATLFLTLTLSGNMPVPLTALIITRDVVLFGAGFYIRYQSLPPPRTLSRYFDMTHATAQLAPTLLSKINTMIQLTTVFSTLSAVVFGYTDHPALLALWYLTGGSTIASALSYLTTKDTYKILKKKKF